MNTYASEAIAKVSNNLKLEALESGMCDVIKIRLKGGMNWEV